MSTSDCHAMPLILFFGRGQGRGGGATAKTYRLEENSGAGFAVEWSGRKRRAGLFLSCSPFSAAKCHGKNPACQWFKGGDFFASFAKKYYPSIDRLDRWNGNGLLTTNGAVPLIGSIAPFCLQQEFIFNLHHCTEFLFVLYIHLHWI